MGILRLWLALCVVISHGNGVIFGYKVLDGSLAVQCFYVISGFYMALVLDRKYGSKTLLFYFNRIVRLYPAYLAALFLAILIQYLSRRAGLERPSTLGNWIDAGIHFPWSTQAIAAVSNLLIEGKDIFIHLVVDPQTLLLKFHPRAIHEGLSASRLIFIPQSWSLGIEFHFYLLAPWVVLRSTRFLLIVSAASLALKIWMTQLGFVLDIYTYRFFPAELCLFLFGVLAYRYLKHVQDHGSPLAASRVAAVFGAVVLVFNAPFIAWMGMPIFVSSLLLLLSAGLPWIFAGTESNQWDRALGELSYPLYLLHLIPIELIAALAPGATPWHAPFAVLSSVALAILVLMGLERPAERWRHRVSEKLVKSWSS